MRCPVCEGPDGRPFQVVGDRAYGRCTRCEATFLFPEQRPSLEAERAEYALHQNTDGDAGYRAFLAKQRPAFIGRWKQGSQVVHDVVARYDGDRGLHR